MLANEPSVLLPTQQPRRASSSPQTSLTPCLPHFREKLEKELLSVEAIDIFLNSLSCRTAKQYQPFVNQWIKYCQVSNIDLYTASITKGIEFLTKLFNSGDLGYSSLNTARSALS